ncbi:Gcd10p-domain-containing protein [Exidia glandulosa HHB12029]|uniref:tRNA (adenine(58)-N(1))-methyltransferase non-catalytic subunit TRM6 n=1 Tax=Exidia glandulosa HHB12029 TaxID=1314781 RepID=A0A165GLC9_EXIGL|nr:Gcd10p-domain-containing protein [Exidia glandulosa HHB12029]
MLSPDTIQAGHTVLVRMPSGEQKSVKLEQKGQISLGKFGSFKGSLLFGHPYGLTYEILSPTEIRVMPPKRLDDFGDVDATAETNELIVDDTTSQTLTHDEIEKLKQAGMGTEAIIQAQISQHSAFELKTAFSKDKYKKRKEAKFLKAVTVLEPTLFTVAEHLFNKDHTKMRDLRSDALAHMLTLSNVAPGKRVLVVDDVSGLLVAGILERLGGTGRLLSITDIESPPSYSALTFFNYDQTLVSSCLASLNWAMTDREFTPFVPPPPEEKDVRTDRQRQRVSKRAQASKEVQDVREDLWSGDFDALLVASVHEPHSIIAHLAPYLRPSAPVVVHSPYPEPLSRAQALLRADPSWLGPTVHAPWMRQHQALPGRTHPMMSMSGTGGYVLSATKVYVHRFVQFVC